MINIRTLAAVVKAKPSTNTAEHSLAGPSKTEVLSRRVALRRIGMVGALAVLGTLSIDDLARLSAKKLQQNQMTRGIGESLAADFRNAGVAFADVSTGSLGGISLKSLPQCVGTNSNCEACLGALFAACQKKAKGDPIKLEKCRYLDTICEAYCVDVADASAAAACWARGS